MPSVEESTVISAAPRKAFEFFRRPQCVIGVSDPALRARIVEAPAVLSHGDTFRIEVVAFGTARKVTYEAIIDFEDLRIDERMVKGDLRAWSHRKSFSADGTNCRIVDEIDFLPPGGLAGFLMTSERIAGQVSDGLAYRNERLQQAVDSFEAS